MVLNSHVKSNAGVYSDCLSTIDAVNSINQQSKMEVLDVVHGLCDLPTDIKSIVMTRQFQRLKDISQLGFLYKILNIERSTRYDHCIGTYLCAQQMLNALENNSKVWVEEHGKLPSLYRSAVEIAGLLHDVGHGPFSHCWEYPDDIEHEKNAFPCIDAIFEEIPKDQLVELRKDGGYGIELIKALIVGEQSYLPENKIFPKEYNFIFEIVNNKQCKLDVDKWDYLKRDRCYFQQFYDNPIPNHDEVFLGARIANDGSHIEYRFEDYDKIYAVFETRYLFTVNNYRIPRSLVCVKLFRKIVERCEKTICGKRLKDISALDMDAFLQLTEAKVLELIDDDPDFKYIKDINQLREVGVNEQSSESNFFVENVIAGPGVEMPPDEHFHFYGDEKLKHVIQRNMDAMKITGYFQLQ